MVAATATKSASIRHRRYARRQLRIGLAFASPWIVGFIAFTAGPMVASLYYSFTQFNIFQSPLWVGAANYRALIADQDFIKSLANTGYMVIVAVPAIQIFSIVTALLLDIKVRGISLYRTIYFLPAVMPTVPLVILWMWLFNPQLGLVNGVLGALHLPQPGWIADPAWAKPMLVLLAMWQCGTITVIYIAALKNVPETLYEAAQLDGAGRWSRFVYVTLPMIAPVIVFNVVVGIIWAFKYFTEAYLLSEYAAGAASNGAGAPQGSLLMYSIYLFVNAFSYLKMGYASAMAWILFVIILFVTLLVLWISRKWSVQ